MAETDLHDAVFTGITLDAAREVIIVRLVGGGLQRGYFRLTTTYRQAKLVGLRPEQLANFVMNRETQVLYDELDSQGRDLYVHRFLLWPTGEFDVRFSDAAVSIAPATNEDYLAAVGFAELVQ